MRDRVENGPSAVEIGGGWSRGRGGGGRRERARARAPHDARRRRETCARARRRRPRTGTDAVRFSFFFFLLLRLINLFIFVSPAPAGPSRRYICFSPGRLNRRRKSACKIPVKSRVKYSESGGRVTQFDGELPQVFAQGELRQ